MARCPLRAHAGEPPFGTLCHFDVVPQEIPAGEISDLEAVAPLIARYLRDR